MWPLFLTRLIGEYVSRRMGDNHDQGEVRRGIRRLYERETGEPLTADDAYSYWRIHERRKLAAEKLAATGGTVGSPGRVSQCPELSHNRSEYHATVYVSMEKPDGTSCGRIPVDLTFEDRLTYQEIIDLAMSVAEDIAANSTGASRTKSGEKIDSRCEPIEETAYLSMVCHS